MDFLKTARDVVSMAEKIENVELLRKLTVLQGELVELAEARRTQAEEIARLRAALDTMRKLRFDAPFYFLEGDSHPVCSRCWEVDRLAVHLAPPSRVIEGPRYDCPNCEAYWIHPRVERPYDRGEPAGGYA